MKRALAAVLLGAAVVAVAGCGGTAKVVSSEPHLLRVADRGPELAGEVTVVAYSSRRAYICPGWAISLDYSANAPGCTDGLPVVGVRAGALTAKAKGDPARWGPLYLVGHYVNGTFYVSSQRHWAPNVRGHDPFAKVPCPAPKGGWLLQRPYRMMQALRHYPRLTGHRDIDSVAFFDKGSILTLASTHPARTRAALGPLGSRQLCVVRTRYAPKVVHAVRHRMVALLASPQSPTEAQWGWPSGAGGSGVDSAGQPITSLEVLVVTPKLRAYLDRQPRGIVVVDAALHPVPASHAGTHGRSATDKGTAPAPSAAQRHRFVRAIERKAAEWGDPHPTRLYVVPTTERRALLIQPGVSHISTRPTPAYLVVAYGHFVAGDVPRPPGAHSPTGSVLTLVFAAGNGKVTSEGLLRRSFALTRAGVPERLPAR